jgi:hypothetical protein
MLNFTDALKIQSILTAGYVSERSLFRLYSKTKLHHEMFSHKDNYEETAKVG